MNEQDKLLDKVEELVRYIYAKGQGNEPQYIDWFRGQAQGILAKVKQGEGRIRELLWATHPCEGKYCDDGELQCGRFLPPIDFKRDSWETIAQGIEKHTEQRIEQTSRELDKPT